jgi:membrane protease YdiL (CAAX protease family)
MGNEFPWPIVPVFLLSLFGATFLLTWLFNRTNGSVLLPMLFHATVNTVGAGLIFPLFSSRASRALVRVWCDLVLCWSRRDSL